MKKILAIVTIFALIGLLPFIVYFIDINIKLGFLATTYYPIAKNILNNIPTEKLHFITGGLIIGWLATLFLSLVTLFEKKNTNQETITHKEKKEEDTNNFINVKAIQNELETLKENYKLLEKKLKEKKQECEDLKEQISKNDSTPEKLEFLTKQNEELKEEIQKLNQTLSDTSNEIENLKNSNKNTNEELNKKSAELEALIDKAQTAQEEAENYKKEINKLKNKINEAKNKIAELTEELNEKRQELESTVANIKSGSNTIPPAAFQILYLLQKEGRLIDLLMEDISEFDDEELGGAIRPIHEGCRKLLQERLIIEPVLNEEEGTQITIEEADPETIKLSGNVPEKGPYTGELIHRGWRLKECHLPELVDGWTGNVVAPAEIEIQ